MRIRGMRESVAAPAAYVAVAAVVAMAAAGSCTVRPADGTGPPHATARVDGTAAPDGKGGGGGGAGEEGEGEGDHQETTPSVPPPRSTPAAPAPRVLWSRGDRGRDVRELQSRLRQVAWLFDGPTGEYDGPTAEAVRGFQGKRGLPRTGATDSVTWARLLGMTREPGKWELYAFGGQPAAAPDARCMTGRVLCISKTSRTLRWMSDGETLLTVEVRFGSESTPTREGVFGVTFKSRHHVSTLYDTPMPYAMFFSGGQAVHYSSDFAARGYYGASHGCVNVRDEARIARLFAQVRTGDKVVVYW
ncbi:L,D-transpeptidase family protein [Streptomyces sp. CRN 30]|uniref:L,D-transpeptidase family protein n=1 Tax=Streptomyces sp. CRN 30 TaxID=3075613 RepID=UPI002A7F173F|nr:L,D-transpeptidase family protein [Streptomyces sp. CRN 30]